VPAVSRRCTVAAAYFSVDSRNENLREKRIHQICANRPARGAAAGFLLRERARPRGAPSSESQTMLFEPGEGGKSLKPPAPRRTNLRL